MAFDNTYTPELDPQEIARLEDARSWEDEDGGLSPLASSALVKLEQQALMFCRHLAGSTSPVIGDQQLSFDPRSGKWSSYHFRVRLRARPLKTPAQNFLTRELKQLGFGVAIGNNPSGQRLRAGVHSSLGGHEGDYWVDVAVHRENASNLEKRSEWLPRRMLHNLPDGSVFAISPEQAGKRVLYVYPRQAVLSQSCVWCPAARSWRTTPDDGRVWPVIEAVQSSSASGGSVMTLLDRLGIPTWGGNPPSAPPKAGPGLPLDPGKHGLFEEAEAALDSIARVATRFRPSFQEGQWTYGLMEGVTFYWSPLEDLSRLDYVAKAVSEAGIVLIQVNNPPSRLLTFTPEGDLLDPQNLKVQQEAFGAKISEFWQKINS
jgi:hypothetical protein